MILKRKNLQPGFSFIEMMIVLVIMGILMTMIGPKVMGLLGKGRKTTTLNSLRLVQQGIIQFKMDTARLPDKLEDLMKKPEGISGWDGPYAGSENSANPTLPKDAWDNDLVYEKKPGAIPPYELYSHGDPEKEDARIDAPNSK